MGLMSNLRMKEFKSNCYNGIYAGKSGVRLQNFATSRGKITYGLGSSFYSSFNKQRFEASPLLSGIIPIIQNAGIQSTSSVSKNIGAKLINTPGFAKQWFRSQTLPSHFINILDNLRVTCFSRKAKLIEIALRSPTFRAVYEKANATPGYDEDSKSGIWTVEMVSPEVARFGGQCWFVARKIEISSKLSDHRFLSVFLFELTNSIQIASFRKLDELMLAGVITPEEYAKRYESVQFKGALYHARIMPTIIDEIWGEDHKFNSEERRGLNCYSGLHSCMKRARFSFFRINANEPLINRAFKIDWVSSRLDNGNTPHTQAYVKYAISARKSIESDRKYIVYYKRAQEMGLETIERNIAFANENKRIQIEEHKQQQEQEQEQYFERMNKNIAPAAENIKSSSDSEMTKNAP